MKNNQNKSVTNTSPNEFILGVTTFFPLIFAVAPIGLLFGALAAQKGLSPLEVLLMGSLVFAGGSQFVALDLWSTPVLWFTIAFSTFLVNLRHVLMSASLAPKLGHWTPLQKYIGFFILADEVWALSERRAMKQRTSFSFYMGVGATLYITWQIATFTGSLVGAVMGDPSQYGLDFAFTALFICLVMNFWQGRKTGVILAASGLAAVLTNKFVPGAWYIIAGAIAGVVAASIQHEEKPKSLSKFEGAQQL
ncbi:Inner membrane protein YgaZ [Pseudovibrio axinellae]|uniref:Inner membrane protein YgaZ n=1 Tax=Pseudovibrio axinellae TaxID=989403 RepID=A0A166ARG9_9HYPH|nr:AzlC family ABC transporter permease [Pseudovibrio axinellae]KZL21461.1 Inner membrane protein YgaZ [Pseudovibrio axinellae]SER06121.1 4-azaleucine resistance probable transporter AzlC [Pseudovibrio axinellae]